LSQTTEDLLRQHAKPHPATPDFWHFFVLAFWETFGSEISSVYYRPKRVYIYNLLQTGSELLYQQVTDQKSPLYLSGELNMYKATNYSCAI